MGYEFFGPLDLSRELMDMIQTNADQLAPTLLLDHLRSAPGRLKNLMKEMEVEYAKNVLALLRMHFHDWPWSTSGWVLLWTFTRSGSRR